MNENKDEFYLAIARDRVERAKTEGNQEEERYHQRFLDMLSKELGVKVLLEIISCPECEAVPQYKSTVHYEHLPHCTCSTPTAPSTLQEVLKQNRALVAAASQGVQEIYKMNRVLNEAALPHVCSAEGCETPTQHKATIAGASQFLCPTCFMKRRTHHESVEWVSDTSESQAPGSLRGAMRAVKEEGAAPDQDWLKSVYDMVDEYRRKCRH